MLGIDAQNRAIRVKEKEEGVLVRREGEIGGRRETEKN